MNDKKLTDSLAFLLASAHRSMRLGVSQSVADEDFTEEHWRVLRVLADEQGHSMGEVAERALLNGPALTKITDKLVMRGMVQRAADPSDNRKVLVFISDTGLELVQRWQAGVDAHQSAIEETLGPRKSAQLKRLLEQFISESTPRVQ